MVNVVSSQVEEVLRAKSSFLIIIGLFKRLRSEDGYPIPEITAKP